MNRLHHENQKPQITLEGSNRLLFTVTLINELLHVLHVLSV